MTLQTRPKPPGPFTSTRPLLHCCETWHVRSGQGQVIPNLPNQRETWAAIALLRGTRPFP